MLHRIVGVALIVLLLAALPAGATQVYVLGPGDVIEVVVFGVPDASRTVTIRPDGFISLPLVGEVKAAGLTPAQLSEELTQRFSRYVRDPQVTVIVVTLRTITVTVFGQVRLPGAKLMKPGATLLDALAASGGVTPTAGLGDVKLVRGQVPPKVVNIEKLLVAGDLSDNPVLQDGDTILVPEDLEAKYMVLGKIAKPGIYPMRGPVTVLEAVTLAGPPLRDAQMSGVFIIRRAAPGLPAASLPAGGKEVSPGVYLIPVDVVRIVRQSELNRDVRLQRGDIVYVPEDRVLLTIDTILNVLGIFSRILGFFPSAP